MQYFSQGTGLAVWALLLLAGLVLTGVAFHYSSRRPWTGQALVAATIMALALLFFAMTFDFPAELVGPALIPRLWIFCIVIIGSALLVAAARGKGEKAPRAGRIGFVLLGIGCMVAYYFAIQTLGYFISSVIFLALMMYLLSYRKPVVIALVSMGWLVFSYLVFYKLLYIQLPLGFFENYL